MSYSTHTIFPGAELQTTAHLLIDAIQLVSAHSWITPGKLRNARGHIPAHTLVTISHAGLQFIRLKEYPDVRIPVCLGWVFKAPREAEQKVTTLLADLQIPIQA